MRNVLNKVRQYLIIAFSFIMILCNTVAAPVYASDWLEPKGSDNVWLRAKITYEYDKGLTGLDDSIIGFHGDSWKKQGDWYYYSSPVEPNQTVTFFDTVSLPSSWNNSTAHLKFNIKVTVEASEVVPGEEGWDTNKEASYSKTFDVWNNGYAHDEDVYVKKGNITISLLEYQLDNSGREVEYKNDKVITPGQVVSKIVKFRVNGSKGGLFTIIPDKPVKTVMFGNVNVDGKKVPENSIVTYGIQVHNTAPDDREITIRDTVDGRLTITDTMGGTIVAGDVNGGTIEWKVKVKAGGYETVHFAARTPELADDEDGMAIPNTATVTALGKEKSTNTVIIMIGKVSKLEQIFTYIQARRTGDPSHFWLMTGGIAAGVIVLIIIAKKRRAVRA